MSKWKQFLLCDWEWRERESRGRRFQMKAPCANVLFQFSTFRRPVSHISLSGPERMADDFRCFVAIECKRRHDFQRGRPPYINTSWKARRPGRITAQLRAWLCSDGVTAIGLLSDFIHDIFCVIGCVEKWGSEMKGQISCKLQPFVFVISYHWPNSSQWELGIISKGAPQFAA